MRVSATPLEGYVDIKTAARFASLTPRRVRELLRQNPPPFPFALVGRVKRVKLSDVRAWLEKSTVGR